MTTVVLTVSDMLSAPSGTAEGGIYGNAEDTLDDGSDATEVAIQRGTASIAKATFAMGTFTLGTGRLKSWLITARMSAVSASATYFEVATDVGIFPLAYFYPTAFATTFVTPAQAPPVLTQAQIDSLQLWVECDPAASGGGLELKEMSLSITYATIPIANVTYPTGNPVLALSTPTVTWTHTAGSDGGPQVQYEVKVFTNAVKVGGGFSADTSATVYASGQITSNVASAVVGPLANSGDYWVYVRTAQSINGVPHWSAWDGEEFTTNYTPSTVSSVTATAGTGLITVVIARNTGTSAWASIEVERSNDNGITWGPVRGGTHVHATNKQTTVWGANSVTIIDYESPNSQAVLYRSRATTAAGITGAWVQSTPAVAWTSTSTFLKDPFNPARNTTIRFQTMPEFTYPREAGIAPVVARADPFVTVDVRRLGVGDMIIHTGTAAGLAALRVLLESTTWLIHAPVSHMVGDPEATGAGGTTFYCVPLDARPMRPVRNATGQNRYWQVSFVQVSRPADDTDYS